MSNHDISNIIQYVENNKILRVGQRHPDSAFFTIGSLDFATVVLYFEDRYVLLAYMLPSYYDKDKTIIKYGRLEVYKYHQPVVQPDLFKGQEQVVYQEPSESLLYLRMEEINDDQFKYLLEFAKAYLAEYQFDQTEKLIAAAVPAPLTEIL